MKSSEVSEIELPKGFHFLIDYEYIEKLLDDAFAKDHVKIVIIKATENLEDSINPKLKNYLSNVYYDELFVVLSRLQKIIKKIHNSTKPTYFCSAHDCTGMNFSLAYSCEKRFWFNAYSRVGFPEIAIGVFPALASIGKKNPITRDLIRAGGVCNSYDGKSLGLVDDLWFWGDLEAELLRLELMRIASSNETIKESILLASPQQLGENEIDRNRALKLDRCRSLSISRRLLESAKSTDDRSSLLTDLYSFYCYDLVSATFRKWLSYQSNLFRGRERIHFSGDEKSVVVIEISKGRPRGVVLKKILLLFDIVMFCSDKDVTLTNRSQSILSEIHNMKFVKGFNAREKVSFFKSDKKINSFLFLSWNDDGQIKVSINGKEKVAYLTRLYADKDGNCIEYVKAKGDDRVFHNLFSHLFLVRLENKNDKQPLILSLSVRALLLDRLVALSRQQGLSPSVVTEGLQKRGWHIPKFSDLVDDFLRLSARVGERPESLISELFDKSIFNREKSDFRGLKLTNKTRYEGQSYHLSIELMKMLYKSRINMADCFKTMGYSSNVVDNAFVLLVGFPSKFGSYESFINEYGKRRVFQEGVASASKANQ